MSSFKQSLTVLDQVDVSNPCPASWDAMEGDDQKRFCNQCNKHVFNLSAMSHDEATQLIADVTGRTCIRFQRNADGSMVTRAAAQPASRKLGWWGRVAAMAAAALGLSVTGCEQSSSGSTGLFQRLFRPRPTVMMGAMCVPAKPVAPAKPVKPGDSPVLPSILDTPKAAHSGRPANQPGND